MKTNSYTGAKIAFATMHGKELLARSPCYDALGADVIAPAALDTDQFGTFSGENARTLSPRAVALVKARLGMQLAGTPYRFASEGSFNAGLGFLVGHHEVLIFIEEIRGLELVEGTITTSPLPPQKPSAPRMPRLHIQGTSDIRNMACCSAAALLESSFRKTSTR